MAVAAKSLPQQEKSHCIGRSCKMSKQFVHLTVGLDVVMGTVMSGGAYLPATPPYSA